MTKKKKIRIQGYDHKKLFALVDKFEATVLSTLRMTMNRTIDSIHTSVTAAASSAGGEFVPVGPDDTNILTTLWATEVDQTLLPLVGEVYFKSARLIESRLAANIKRDIASVPDDIAVEYVSQARNRLRGVGDRAWELAREEIAKGTAEGESIETLSTRLRSVVGFTEPRASTVARTEIISAANLGSIQQARASNLQMNKVWLATEDARTRPTHNRADNQSVGLNEKFVVGSTTLDFPGSPLGPADEVINCRCTIVYEDIEVPEKIESTPIVAAGADVMTGAMIALRPSIEDAERIALPGGEDVNQLHCTLWYLGDAVNYDDVLRNQIIHVVSQIAIDQISISTTGFGAAFWNPDSDNPSLVMNISGSGPAEVREEINRHLEELWAYTGCLPVQHSPYVQHVCLAYGKPDENRMDEALARLGPITFDAIRIAFAGEVTDIPLYSGIGLVAGLNFVGKTMPYEIHKSSSCPDSKPYGIFKKESGEKVGGCHSSESDAQDQIAAIYANESSSGGESIALDSNSMPASGDAGSPGDTNLPAHTGMMSDRTWEGILVVEGVKTGDGRQFASGSLTWDTLPMPLRWAPADYGEHQGAVDVARIDAIYRDSANANIIRGHGVFMQEGLTPESDRAFAMVRDGFLKGVSIDVDSIANADVEVIYPDVDEDASLEEMWAPPDLVIFHSGRIRAATLVSIPAFVEAQISLAPLSVEPVEAVTAAVDTFWDFKSTMSRARRDVFQKGKIGSVFHHDVKADGSLGLANVTACTIGIRDALTNPDPNFTYAQRRANYEHLAGHLRAAGLEPQQFTIDAFSDEVKAIVAAGSSEQFGVPPREWFDNPQLTGPTGLTITEDGRVFGHAATWGTCHIGFANACRTPPHEDAHDFFLLGEVLTSSGERIPVGSITIGTGHAATSGLNAQKAAEHYDNTGTAIADVTSGNDEYGIWVAGAIRPGTSLSRVADLRAAKLSGDWRSIGGKLRLVALLAVNVPGFPIPRAQAQVRDGRQLSLVASGIISDHPVETGIVNTRDVERITSLNKIKASLARRTGRDAESRANALRARIHGGNNV